MLTEAIDPKRKELAFNHEEVRRVLYYIQGTYFRHIRLYKFVLDSTTESEVKRVTVNQNEPKLASDLNSALALSKDSMVHYEDEELNHKEKLAQLRREAEAKAAAAEAKTLRK
mmetsp:Transcript_63390/g.87565  ORF Transcript_63390/g.87565 Transcript_63390/m.87565 type:complete len:113 (+) Transcript_63390:533-871(+)